MTAPIGKNTMKIIRMQKPPVIVHPFRGMCEIYGKLYGTSVHVTEYTMWSILSAVTRGKP